MPAEILYRSHALTDAELVRLALNGEHDAFRVIMQRSNQQLYRAARSVVRDDAEAEDVVQEAYARAFAALAEFRGEASLKSWLTRIALNEARARLRRRRVAVDLSALDAGQETLATHFAAPSANPEIDAARAEIRTLIERAVDALPEAFRIVFVMRDIQECSIEETAASLDVRPETVKTRLHRARRLLRRALHHRLSTTLTDVFPFLGERCQRITGRMLRRLAGAGLAPFHSA